MFNKLPPIYVSLIAEYLDIQSSLTFIRTCKYIHNILVAYSTDDAKYGTLILNLFDTDKISDKKKIDVKILKINSRDLLKYTYAENTVKLFIGGHIGINLSEYVMDTFYKIDLLYLTGNITIKDLEIRDNNFTIVCNKILIIDAHIEMLCLKCKWIEIEDMPYLNIKTINIYSSSYNYELALNLPEIGKIVFHNFKKLIKINKRQSYTKDIEFNNCSEAFINLIKN